MTEKSIVMIKTEQLEHHPDNPRKNIGDIEELTASIKQDGILQNLTVVPKPDAAGVYLVVIGNRRLEAGKAAGLSAFPCVISDMDYIKQLETMLIENINRTDLTIVEQAQGFQQLTLAGFTVSDISNKTGFSESTINRRLKLCQYSSAKVNEAQERGATIGDFAKLEQIKKKPAREKLLKIIGTPDFNNAFKQALDTQKEDELLKVICKVLAEFSEPLPEGTDIYSSKLQRLYDYGFDVLNYTQKTKMPPHKRGQKIFYKIETGYYDKKRRIVFLQPREEQKEEKPQRKGLTDEEKEKRRVMREFRGIENRLFQLRLDFIKELVKRERFPDYEKICCKVFIGAMVAYGYDAGNYSYAKIFELLEIPGVYHDGCYDGKVMKEYIASHPAGAYIAFAYSKLHDSADKNCRGWADIKYGKYNSNSMQKLYDFLTALGYQMSEEEQQILDGTHPLYKKDGEIYE